MLQHNEADSEYSPEHQSEQRGEDTLSVEELIHNLHCLSTASFETTAHVIACTLYFLADNPSIAGRKRQGQGSRWSSPTYDESHESGDQGIDEAATTRLANGEVECQGSPGGRYQVSREIECHHRRGGHAQK